MHNSRLLRTYARVGVEARALMLLVKAWAKARGVASAHDGTPSSYCHVVLAVACLQRALPRLSGR